MIQRFVILNSKQSKMIYLVGQLWMELIAIRLVAGLLAIVIIVVKMDIAVQERDTISMEIVQKK